MPQEKRLRIKPEEMRPLANGYGGCFASDRITVDGRPVGYMYREAEEFDEDSGWRFLAGDETDEYMEQADHFGIYDVNTIANYDPEIIPFLEMPDGFAFERDAEGRFIQVAYEGDEEEEEEEDEEEEEE